MVKSSCTLTLNCLACQIRYAWPKIKGWSPCEVAKCWSTPGDATFHRGTLLPRLLCSYTRLGWAGERLTGAIAQTMQHAQQRERIGSYWRILCNEPYSRNLYVRAAEHAGLSYRTGQPLSSPPQSSIRDYAVICNSSQYINSDHFKIIGTSQNTTELRILESIFIKREPPPPPPLNNTFSAFPLRIT